MHFSPPCEINLEVDAVILTKLWYDDYRIPWPAVGAQRFGPTLPWSTPRTLNLNSKRRFTATGKTFREWAVPLMMARGSSRKETLNVSRTICDKLNSQSIIYPMIMQHYSNIWRKLPTFVYNICKQLLHKGKHYWKIISFEAIQWLIGSPQTCNSKFLSPELFLLFTCPW